MSLVAADVAEGIPRGFFSSVDLRYYAHFGVSTLLHVGILGTLALGMPRPAGVDSLDDDGDNVALMRRLLAASDGEAGEEGRPEGNDSVAQARTAPPRDARRGEELVGKNLDRTMGNSDARRSVLRYGVAGPVDNPDPHIARQAALAEALQFGMIGLLEGEQAANAPAAPWGRDDAVGRDPESARGGMWGDTIGDTFGAGGLGLSGVGAGSGDRVEAVAMGAIHTLDGGQGQGQGQGQGWGCGCMHGRLSGRHTTRAPVLLSTGALTTSGRLPPEVIQRIVRQNFGRFRLCYEHGLRANATLGGRVAVKFVIDRTGSVSVASDAGSDLGDSEVVSCVVRRFEDLSFPEPQGGIVTVVYPLFFSGGD